MIACKTNNNSVLRFSGQTITTIILFVVYFHVCCDESKFTDKTTDEQHVSSLAAGLLQYSALILYWPATEYCRELWRLLRCVLVPDSLAASPQLME